MERDRLRVWTVWLAAALVSCAGPDDTGPSDSDPLVDTDTDTDTDTDESAHYGWIHVRQRSGIDWAPFYGSGVDALFREGVGSYRQTLGTCTVFTHLCPAAQASLDTLHEPLPHDAMDFADDMVPTQDIGPASIGPISLRYRTMYDRDGYRGVFTDLRVTGRQALTFGGGAWGAYSGTDDVLFPQAFVPTGPALGRTLRLEPDEPLELGWRPDLPGTPFVYVRVWQGDEDPAQLWFYPTWHQHRTTELVDDGAFTLDFDQLPIQGDLAQIDVFLGRRGSEVIRVLDNEVDVGWEHTYGWTAFHVDTSGREALRLADDCRALASVDPVAPGSYHADLTLLTNSIDVPIEERPEYMTGNWTSKGVDGVFKVEIPAGQTLMVDYERIPDAPQALVFERCGSQTPITGDYETARFRAEHVEVPNDGSEPRVVYVVLDAGVYGATGEQLKTVLFDVAFAD